MKRLFALAVSLALTALSLVGCGGSSSTKSSPSSPQAGAVYVTGEDAPLASVVSLNFTINSITLTGAKNSPALVSTPITVDFARLVGLRTPLGFGTVPADTYSSATFVLASPVITSITTVTPTTLAGTFTAPTSTAPQTKSVTVTFPTPMVVAANSLVGLHMEFDIARSLAVDGTGQVTGVITPVMFAEAVKATDAEGQITELTGRIAAVSTANSSFTMQGPIGTQITVAVNDSTTFNQGFTLPTLPGTGAFVALQGTVQKDGSILASDVEVITTDSAFVSGRVLAFTPTTGVAASVTLWVDETGGGTTALLDTVQTINIAAVTVYNVCPFNNGWFTTTGLFSNSLLLVGQRIFVGGTFASPVLAPDVISLRRQGVYGNVVPASVTVTNAATSAGTFQLSNTGLLGYTLAAPLKVNTGSGTLFFQGNSSNSTLGVLGAASATASVGVVARGLVLKDGNAVLWAHRVRAVEVLQ
jgi:hypothetical protein